MNWIHPYAKGGFQESSTFLGDHHGSDTSNELDLAYFERKLSIAMVICLLAVGAREKMKLFAHR